MKHFSLLLILLFCSTIINAQDLPFKKYKPCSFSIDLPEEMSLSKVSEDSSPDFCDYEVKLQDGYVIMKLNSLIKSRFEFNSIEDLYTLALSSSDLDIKYTLLCSNCFIISGFNKNNENIFYWKRCLGENFISDMTIEYNKGRKKEIEKFIDEISKSFKSY
jgi:hypothetical protein